MYLYFNHVSSSHQTSNGEDLTVGAKRNLTVLLASGEYCVNLDTILTRSEQNGEISLGTYSQVLPHWTLDCDIFQSRVLSCNAPEKCRRLIMIGLYHHQLLILPGFIRSCGDAFWINLGKINLGKIDPESIATAANETGREMLSLGSLPRPYHALQHELVPVASRESHRFLPIPFPMVSFFVLL